MSTDLTRAPSGGRPENNALQTLQTPDFQPPAAQSPRVWPFAVLVALFWAWSFFFQWAEVETGYRFLGRVSISALLVLLFIILWWANWRISLVEKILVFFVAVAGGIATAFLTLKTFGPIALLMTALPVVATTWAVWLQLSPLVGSRVRQIGLFAVILLTWGAFTLLRMDGISGQQEAALHWRWTPTPEQLYLEQRAQRNAEAADHPTPQTTVSLRPGDWPGFRGPERDGAVHGLKIATDWNTAPPRLLWKQRVGPGWSSVAVVGGRLYTQEQRDQVEAVVCLDAATGREIWSREEPARFEESVAGAGPRATPTFADGRIYALGATGVLSCRDAAGGDLNWSRNLVAEVGAKAPLWGFCSSPLVVNGVVVVYVEGGPKNLLACRADSGEPAWAAAAGKASYSSPQPASFNGQSQVLFLSDGGLSALDPASGKLLWEHAASSPGAPRTLQPHVVGESHVLISSEADLGTALIDVARGDDGWTATRRWANKNVKSSFNDFVVHDGWIYGFDGDAFCCAEVKTGERRWRQGRFGHGQAILLADQGLVLVMTEKGHAVLLAANPDKYEELGRFQAVEGKTWNHPVIANGRLFVRNGEEIACYQLGLLDAP